MLEQLKHTLAPYKPECYCAPCPSFPDLKNGEGVFILSAKYLSDDLYISYTDDMLIFIYQHDIQYFCHPTRFDIQCPGRCAWEIRVANAHGESKMFSFGSQPVQDVSDQKPRQQRSPRQLN
jgi:hypothetical protein